MKKFSCIISLAVLITINCRSQQEERFVLLGQLYGTAQFGFPEKVKGKVRELRQLNFLPAEENGRVIKVRPLTTTDRITAPSGKDYFEEYDSSGIVIKSGTLDENGKLIEYWDVDTDSGKIERAFHYSNDRLVSEINVLYKENKISQIQYLIPAKNILLRGVSIDYDQNGNRIKYYYSNGRGITVSTTEFFCNDKNQIDSIRSFNITGRPTIIFRYGYNDNGDKISQQQENYVDGDIRAYSFVYEFDKMGNYITMIFMKDNKPIIYRERQIKYYE